MNLCYIKIYFIFIVVPLLIVWSGVEGFTLSPKTHREINSYIADEKLTEYGEDIDKYLKNYLGMKDGVKTNINFQMVKEWIAYGGEKEDSGGVRSMYHFHNPMNNEGLIKDVSAVTWATLPVEGQNLAPLSSWNDVRYYYERALTDKDKTEREKWFALTFQGVGQIMHLVEDMSVPAHTRHDTHLPFLDSDGYEKWFVDEKATPKTPSIIEYPIYNGYTPFNKDLFLIPQLFDSGKYVGTNPGDTLLSTIGLAEYTNANFYSGDTLNAINFPYPQVDANKTHVEPFKGPQGLHYRQYYLKDCNEVNYCQQSTVPGKEKAYDGYLLRAVDLNAYWDQKLSNPVNLKHDIPILDDNVHRDYAQLLIPRAICYAAEALKYFFRGQLDVTMGVGSLTIKNTSRETMSGGKFYLYYDNSNDERKSIEISNSAVSTLAKDGEGEQTISFNQPTETVKSYTLVYKGQLGGESNAVIGKVIESAVWEPWNGPLVNSKNTWQTIAYGTNPFSIDKIDNNGFLNFDLTTAAPEGVFAGLWIETSIPIPKSEMYFNISSTLTTPSVLPNGSGYSVMWIKLQDDNENSKTFFFGWSAPYPPSDSWTLMDSNNDGKNPISLSPLTGHIEFIAIGANLCPGARGQFKSDFIDFR